MEMPIDHILKTYTLPTIIIGGHGAYASGWTVGTVYLLALSPLLSRPACTILSLIKGHGAYTSGWQLGLLHRNLHIAHICLSLEEI